MQGPDFWCWFDTTQFSYIPLCSPNTCKYAFNPNVTTFQSNCAESLHFSAFIITVLQRTETFIESNTSFSSSSSPSYPPSSETEGGGGWESSCILVCGCLAVGLTRPTFVWGCVETSSSAFDVDISLYKRTTCKYRMHQVLYDKNICSLVHSDHRCLGYIVVLDM